MTSGLGICNPDKQKTVSNLTIKQPDFDLPKKIWVTLNRLPTGYGRCKHLLHKWKLENSLLATADVYLKQSHK